MIRVVAISLLFGSSYALGAEVATGAARVPGVSTGDWLQMILGLAVMIGLIMLLAAMLRRFGGPVTGNSRHLKLLSVLPIGPRDRIALVQVGNEQIVVGVSAQGVRMLHVLSEPVEDSGEPANSEFARKLTEMLRRERGDAKTVDVETDP